MKRLRGLYFAPVDPHRDEHSGILKKMRYQTAALKRLGMDIQFVYFHDNQIISDEKGVLHRFKNNSAIHRRLYYFRNQYLQLPRLIPPQELDFIYIRFQRSSPWLLHFLKAYKQGNPAIKIALEIPTFPYELEVPTLQMRLINMLDRATRQRLKHFVDVVPNFNSMTEILGMKGLPIRNGVDLESSPLTTSLPADPRKITLIAVANIADWHGIDRLIEGLHNYYSAGQPATEVRAIIGGGGNLVQTLQQRAEQTAAAPYIHFAGHITGEKLDNYYRQAHVGIGSLGLHRLGLTCGSVLKVAEYSSRGLPFCISYLDESFPSGSPFLFQAPPDDSPLDIPAVIAFRERLASLHPNYPTDLRNFVAQNLTWEAQLRQVLNAVGLA